MERFRGGESGSRIRRIARWLSVESSDRASILDLHPMRPLLSGTSFSSSWTSRVRRPAFSIPARSEPWPDESPAAWDRSARLAG